MFHCIALGARWMFLKYSYGVNDLPTRQYHSVDFLISVVGVVPGYGFSMCSGPGCPLVQSSWHCHRYVACFGRSLLQAFRRERHVSLGWFVAIWNDPLVICTDPFAIWTDPFAIWTDPFAIWIDPFAIWTDAFARWYHFWPLLKRYWTLLNHCWPLLNHYWPLS
jgi:hypothetical protein